MPETLRGPQVAVPDPVRTMPGALVVDARALDASGIGRYLRELLSAWLHDPPFERLVLLGAPAALERFVAGHERATRPLIVSHEGGFYSIDAQRSWLRARRAEAVRGASVAFFPHWDAPIVAMPARSVVAVHDLIHFRVPDAFSAMKRLIAGPVLRRVVHGASRIVCGSHATARDLAAMHPESANRVDVVPYGVGAPFTEEPTGPAPVAGRYLLCVGNQKAHKNLAAAVDVLRRLHARGHTDVRLAVVGRRFDLRGAVTPAAESYGVAESIVELGEVSDATLASLYAHCVALLFPSRYEGFGLPIVEAMSLGAPVVASSSPAVAEAVGGVSPVFAPDDVEGMASAVEGLMGDPVRRAEWSARGRIRAAKLSWSASARRTARVLQWVASGADFGRTKPDRVGSASTVGGTGGSIE